MFNNDSQSEENESHMNNLFFFLFNIDEHDILEDDIISKFLTIPKMTNDNKNEDSEDSEYGKAKTGDKSFFKVIKKNSKLEEKEKMKRKFLLILAIINITQIIF